MGVRRKISGKSQIFFQSTGASRFQSIDLAFVSKAQREDIAKMFEEI